MVSTLTQPDFTSQEPTDYKTAIDAAISVLTRTAAMFAPHQQTTADMTVRIDAGSIFDGTTLTEVAAQNTGTITAPATNPRIDRIVIDRGTGAVSVITGTEDASPSAPAITAGKVPIAQVSLTTGTTEIANADITDERNLESLGLGALAFLDTVDTAQIADESVSRAKLDLSTAPEANFLINGDFRIWQRGTSFTAATTPANNDDTYLADRWLNLSDGNDIVDVSQETTTVPTGSYAAINLDVETANKQFAIAQILETKDSERLIGSAATFSFKARKGGSNATLETLRAAIISWNSTADAVTSDAIGTWAGGGTDPTLATNWTYENTPSDLTLTDSFQTFTISASIDTSATTNVAVIIWCDDTDATVADTVYITDAKLEPGTVATDFAHRPFGEELALCQRYLPAFVSASGVKDICMGQCIGTTSGRLIYPFKVPARIAPTGITTTTVSSSFSLTNNIDTPAAATAAVFVDSSTESCTIGVSIASGLTAGNATRMKTQDASVYILFDGCEL